MKPHLREILPLVPLDDRTWARLHHADIDDMRRELVWAELRGAQALLANVLVAGRETVIWTTADGRVISDLSWLRDRCRLLQARLRRFSFEVTGA